jgi:hypothetical protein
MARKRRAWQPDRQIVEMFGDPEVNQFLSDALALPRRVKAMGETLKNSGEFCELEIEQALYSRESQTKEAPARWLRAELAKLREAERQGIGAPVRLGNSMSRLKISDIAAYMLEESRSPGPQLRALIMELLDVDRHGAALAQQQPAAFEAAVQIDGRVKGARRKLPSAAELARLLESYHRMEVAA